MSLLSLQVIFNTYNKACIMNLNGIGYSQANELEIVVRPSEDKKDLRGPYQIDRIDGTSIHCISLYGEDIKWILENESKIGDFKLKDRVQISKKTHPDNSKYYTMQLAASPPTKLKPFPLKYLHDIAASVSPYSKDCGP